MLDNAPRALSPVGHAKFKFSTEPTDYRLLQSFGERRDYCSQDDEDFITAISFDRTGDYLAVGDRAGRMIIFKYVANSPYENFEEDKVVYEKSTHNLKYKRISSKDFSPSNVGIYNNPVEYEYLYDFQSHLKEFDYMKSEEIDQKINFVRWLNNNGSQMNVVSSNSKTIKLWKITEKMVKKKRGSEDAMQSSITRVCLEYETTYKHSLKQEFFKLHKYALNSISLTKNDEFMLTSDDLKVYLWSLNDSNKPYNVINRTPFDMEELSEVITCSSLSKKNDNIFLFGTSKGMVNMVDMRIAGVCDKNCTEFKSKKLKEKETTFFSDILGSISSCDFNHEEDLILAREYLNLKVWDVRNQKEPINIIPINDEVKGHLCKLYESEGIFDKFRISMNSKRKTVITGSYNDSFQLLNLNNGENYQFRILANDQVTVQKLVNGKKPEAEGQNGTTNGKKIPLNLTNKILQTEFHPNKNCFALACLNCLYVFGV